MTNLMLISPIAVERGLYISEFSQDQVRAFGLEPPPMLWIFEWDIIVGVPSVLSSIYLSVKNNLTGAIEEGFEAIKLVQTMIGLGSGFEGNTDLPDSWYSLLIESLEYELSLFTTLAWYRSYFLNYFAWLDHGDDEYYDNWNIALERYQISSQNHINIYEDNLDFPVYNFFEVNKTTQFYERNVLMCRIVYTLK